MGEARAGYPRLALYTRDETFNFAIHCAVHSHQSGCLRGCAIAAKRAYAAACTYPNRANTACNANAN